MVQSASEDSDPPGTQWLRSSRMTPGARAQQLAQQRGIQLADEPALGSTQFGLFPRERRGDWGIYISPSDSDQWRLQDSHQDLGKALELLQWYRGLYK